MDGPVVLDTSVVIKWFRQGEVLADQALALRKAYLDGQIEITVPSLLAYELANVLRYKGDLTTGQVQDAVQSLFDMRLEWLLPSSVAMRRAVEIALGHETTVYDATFAALAETLEATFHPSYAVVKVPFKPDGSIHGGHKYPRRTRRARRARRTRRARRARRSTDGGANLER